MSPVLLALLAVPPTVEGVWVSADDQANRAAIERGIAAAAEPFGPITFVVRSALRDVSPVFPSVTIRRAGDLVTCLTPPVAATTTRGEGTTIGLDRAVNQLTHAMTTTTLTQVTWNDAGRRRTVFTVSPSGDRLEVAVEVTAPRLSVPVRYVMQYRRAVTLDAGTPAAPRPAERR